MSLNCWRTSVAPGAVGPDVPALAIDPLTANTLYAGTFGSGIFAIQQVEASPTPTTTQRPTNTPTATPIAGGGGGCTVTPRDAGEGYRSAYLLVPILVLSRARRRRMVAAHS